MFGGGLLVTGLTFWLLVVVVLGTGFGLGFGGGCWLLGLLGGGLGGGAVVLELNFRINWCIRLGFWSGFAPLCKVWWFKSGLGLCLGLSEIFIVSSITTVFSIFPFSSITKFPSSLRSWDLFTTRFYGIGVRPVWAPD